MDGSLIPNVSSKLLSQGRFRRGINLILACNSDEGLLFTSPFITNQTSYTAYIEQLLPTASPSVISYITNTLYPPVFNNTTLYTDQYGRTALTIADFEFHCNERFLAAVLPELTHSFFSPVSPGLHGENQQYIFFNGDTTTLDDGDPVNVTLAGMLQGLLTQFVVTGNLGFDMYGDEESVFVVDVMN